MVSDDQTTITGSEWTSDEDETRLITDGGRDIEDERDDDENEGVLAVEYESLWYIKIRGKDDKRPLETWGGYDQDFEDAECVYSHAEVVESDHKWWGVVGYQADPRMPRELLIFDLDTHKADDPEAAVEDLTVTGKTFITRSQSGGNHVWFTVTADKGEFKESDFEVHEDLDFDIDIRGSAVSHHVVAPADIPGIGGSYEVVNDETVMNRLAAEEVCEEVQLAGEPAVEYAPNRGFGDSDGDSEYTPDGDEWLLESDVKDALSKVPAGLGYAEWRDIVFAVADFYARTDGEREDAVETIVEWSKTAPDAFDEDTERHAFNIVKSGFESVENDDPDRVTVGTLLSVAEANGWEWPPVAERKALRDVRTFIDEYDPREDRPEKPEEREDDPDAWDAWPGKDDYCEVADAVANLSDEDYEANADDLIDRLLLDRDRLDEHRSLKQVVQNTESNIVNNDGELVKVKWSDHGWVTPETLLNFELDVTSLLSIEGEDRMANVEVRPAEPTESPFEMQIEPRVFNDARRFKDEILAKRFSTTIETSMPESDVMDRLRKYISRQDVPDLVGQKQMGLSQSGDEFVTPNGTIDSDGWVDEPDAIHVERDIGAERKFAADPDEHGEIDNDEIARMIELFTRTRNSERFVPVLGWMYAAPFRPEIVERTGSFNLLHVNGDSGVGKTGTLGVASRLFGMSAEPFSCTDTTFATITTLASSRGVPIWLDEYKTSEMADWQTSKLHELLRKAATGGVEQRGRADQSTEEYHLRAPVVIAGETAIRGSAEQRRTIEVTFTNAPTQSGTLEYRRFKDLVGDATTDEDGNVTFPDVNFTLEDHAVKYYSYVAATDPADFEAVWFSAREYVSKRLAEWDVDLDDLEVQGLQTIVAGYRMMVSFANAVGADLDKLPGEEDLDEALRYVADVEGDGRETHIDQFTQLVQRATVAGYLEEGTHFAVVRAGKSGEELRVNVDRAFDAVSKYVRDHDLNEDLLGSAKDYKSRYTEAEDQDTYVTCTSQGTPGVGRAIGIHTGRAGNEIESFDREVFINPNGEYVPEHADDSDSDDDPGGATPVAKLDPDAGTGYDTVTVTVTNWERPEDSPIEARGTVKDESSPIRVVDFHGSSPATIEEGDTYRVKNATVDEYDGNTQLIVEEGTTEFVPIQQGVGYTEPSDSSEGQETMDDADGCSASGSGESSQNAVRADGGNGDEGTVNDDTDGDAEEDANDESNPEREAVRRTVRQVAAANAMKADGHGEQRSAIAAQAAGRCGADLETVKHVIDKMVTEGDLIETRGSRVIVNGGDA